MFCHFGKKLLGSPKSPVAQSYENKLVYLILGATFQKTLCSKNTSKVGVESIATLAKFSLNWNLFINVELIVSILLLYSCLFLSSSNKVFFLFLFHPQVRLRSHRARRLRADDPVGDHRALLRHILPAGEEEPQVGPDRVLRRGLAAIQPAKVRITSYIRYLGAIGKETEEWQGLEIALLISVGNCFNNIFSWKLCCRLGALLLAFK